MLTPDLQFDAKGKNVVDQAERILQNLKASDARELPAVTVVMEAASYQVKPTQVREHLSNYAWEISVATHYEMAPTVAYGWLLQQLKKQGKISDACCRYEMALKWSENVAAREINTPIEQQKTQVAQLLDRIKDAPTIEEAAHQEKVRKQQLLEGKTAEDLVPVRKLNLP